MAEELAGAPRRPSMADVAALAGVSGQTVSRVANAHPRVDPETRARVEAAMANLGYRPHRAARALRTGRTQSIGLVVSTLASVGNTRMLEAIVTAASARGYAVVVASLGGSDDVEPAYAMLREQGVDGAIVLNEASARAHSSAVAGGLQLVVVDSPADDRFTIVESDHRGGARAATAHLLELGHDTVWHLAGPEDSFAAAEREAGWREALRTAGAEAPEVRRGDWTAASGHTAGTWIAAQSATAVFAANDQMALGLLRALRESGRAVPRDVSVVGFDDIADAAEFPPPLTTVRQDFDGLGAAALAALVDRIEGSAVSPVPVLVPTRLVVRASTAEAAS